MNDTDDLTTQEVLARTIWGEARGEPAPGLQAVANVVMNRVNSGITSWGSDVRSVCLHRNQFSCWREDDPNRTKLLAVTEADAVYRECVELAGEAMDGDLADVTNGATNYCTLVTYPPWAEGRTPVKIIGHHKFFIT